MSKINYWNIMTRRKPMPMSESDDSKLGRVFSTFDLTALGVSATLGVGVYVLAGHVARLEAGPSVILSFAIAAAASFLAGNTMIIMLSAIQQINGRVCLFIFILTN
jgi:amino acid transporter